MVIGFIFDCVNLLHYKCNKINLRRSGSYMDSPGWIKKVTINLRYMMIVNAFKSHISFATVTLNHNDKFARNVKN